MPTTIPQLPDYPVHVYAEPDRRKRISLGAGKVFVTYVKGGQTKELKGPLVIDQAVDLSGDGGVTIAPTDDKAPRAKRPSEAKKKQVAKKAEPQKASASTAKGKKK